jgi:hypothetical protein
MKLVLGLRLESMLKNLHVVAELKSKSQCICLIGFLRTLKYSCSVCCKNLC